MSVDVAVRPRLDLRVLVRWLMCAIVPLEVAIALGATPLASLRLPLLGLLVGAGLRLGSPGARRGAMVLALLSAGLFVAGGHWQAAREGVSSAFVFVALLPTLAFMRAFVEAQPVMERVRNRFGFLPSDQRSGAIFLATHLLGSMLNMASLAVVAPLVRADASEGERRDAALSAVRGLSLVVLWSPFSVSITLVTGLAQMPVWHASLAGLGVATVAVLGSLLDPGTRLGARALVQVTRLLSPLLGPLFCGAVLAVGVSIVTGMGSVSAVAVVMPGYTACWLALTRAEAIPRALAAWHAGVERYVDEALTFTAMVVLARAVAGFPGLIPMVDTLMPAGGLSPLLLASGTVLVLAGATLGIHVMVTSTIVLSLLVGHASSEVERIVLVVTVLSAWALGAANTFGSLAIFATARQYAVAPDRLIWSRNLPFLAALHALVLAGGAAVLAWLGP